MALRRDREPDPGQIDDPVGRRDEERQIVQAVAVDAPEQRPGRLPDRRERDHAERLRSAVERHLRERRDEHGPRDDAERKLLGVVGEVVERQQRRKVRGAEDDRYGCLNWSSCHEGTGASSSSGRPPPPGCW